MIFLNIVNWWRYCSTKNYNKWNGMSYEKCTGLALVGDCYGPDKSKVKN